MTTTQPRTPTRRTPTHAHARPRSTPDGEGLTPHRDPIELAAALRDLAARAHRAVRALSASASDEPRHELADLHPKIVELQRAIDARSPSDLASYLDALRREVESRMA